MSRKPKFMQNQSLYNNESPIPLRCFRCNQSGVIKKSRLLVCGYRKYKDCKKVRDEFKIPEYFSLLLNATKSYNKKQGV